MGYEPFQLRRLYNPPKQIAWTPNMLIGNIAFRVLGVVNRPLPAETNPQQITGPGEWLMTMQLSEN